MNEPGQFWSLQNAVSHDSEQDKEPKPETPRYDARGAGTHGCNLVDSVPTEQRMSAVFVLPSSALSTRLAPSVYGQPSIQTGRVHTLPPINSSASYSKKVLKRANRLQLLPKQEHTRLALSQSLITT